MTVQAATKMWSRDGGTIATDDGLNRRVTIKEGYQVVCDATDKIEDVLDATDLPRLEDRYIPGTAIFCKSKDPVRVGPVLWVVVVTWDGEFGPGGSTDHPVNQPPEIEWSDVETSEEIDEDWNGKPIATVNGEPIRGVTMPVIDQILTVSRKFIAIDTYAISRYRKATNSDSFAGWPPGTCRFVGYTAKRGFSGDAEYWDVNAKFQFREPYRTTPARAWYARARHEGFFIKDGTKIKRAFDGNKEPTVKPVLLKADGTRETDQDNAVWLEFQLFDSLPFAALGMTDG